MSGGSILGGIVGAVAGFFMPGGGAVMAMKGAQIGMTIGGYLDPPKTPTIVGPRLDDLTIQTCTYGATIPRAYGTIGLLGNVFWIENNALKETVTKKKSGGKGGGSSSTTKTYSYYATFAVGLCRGPITGVKRIWVGSKLVYDASNATLEGIIQSNSAVKNIDIHLGTDTQLPNPRMQATLGVANTPAYRGLAYIVFKDFALKDYSNTIQGAQVKVEIVKSHSTTTTLVYTGPAMTLALSFLPLLSHNGTGNAHSMFNFGFSQSGEYTSTYGISITGGNVILESVRDVYGKVQAKTLSFPCTYTNGNFSSGVGAHVSSDDRTLAVSVNTTGEVIIFRFDLQLYKKCNGVKLPIPSAKILSQAKYGDNLYLLVGQDGTSFRAIYHVSLTGSTYTVNLLVSFETAVVGLLFADSAGWVILAGAVLKTYAHNSPVELSSTTLSTVSASTVTGIARISGGMLFEKRPTLYYLPDGESIPQAIGTTANQYASGYVYGYYSNGLWISPYSSDYKYYDNVRYLGVNILSSNTALLSSTVSSECQLGGLTTSDIDVTALSTKTIRGYKISSTAAIKGSLDQLQAVHPFDIIQSGYKLKFKLRGGASVVTIPKDDLAAVGVS